MIITLNYKRHMAEERDENRGDMTVSEAGHMGGERVRELINEGKESEGESFRDDTRSEDEREM